MFLTEQNLTEKPYMLFVY